MRRSTKTRIAFIMFAILIGWLATFIPRACEVAWAQTPPATPEVKLTEVEELKLVNTYQAAVLAQVDAQAAQQRLQQRRDAYMQMVEQLRSVHKWDAATTFEINAETGKVLVHIPPAKSDTSDTKKPNQGKKEQ